MRRSLVVLTLAGFCCLPRPATAFEQTDLDRLLTTNECQKCDLSGASLVGKDLSKAKLEGANLSGADLTKASLGMADLAGANLSGANLSGAVFDAADLFQANLSGVVIAGARFDGAYLSEATLDNDTRKALLDHSTPWAETASAPSSPVVATEGGLPEKVSDSPVPAPVEVAQASAAETKPEAPKEAAPAHLDPSEGVKPAQEAMVAPATPKALPVADPAPATGPVQGEDLLKQAKKSGFCIECDFSGAMLDGASMKGLNLARANFSGAQLTGVNFKEADLKAANFRGATLKGAVFKGADLYLADFSGADLTDADFRGALLGGEVLSDANLSGALFDEPKK